MPPPQAAYVTRGDAASHAGTACSYREACKPSAPSIASRRKSSADNDNRAAPARAMLHSRRRGKPCTSRATIAPARESAWASPSGSSRCPARRRSLRRAFLLQTASALAVLLPCKSSTFRYPNLLGCRIYTPRGTAVVYFGSCAGLPESAGIGQSSASRQPRSSATRGMGRPPISWRTAIPQSLSDLLLFVVARVLDRAASRPDVLWQQGKNRD